MVEAKVFGLPRSGTNYLRWLLDRNFNEVNTNKDVCWEHSLPHQRKGVIDRRIVKQRGTALENTEGMVRLAIAKDYEHWVVSYYRAEERGTAEMMADHYGYVRPDAIYKKWLAAWAPHAHFIRYESFLADFPSTLRYLGTLLGTGPDAFYEPETVPESPFWRPSHRRRYL